jgi:hypothetical protein
VTGRKRRAISEEKIEALTEMICWAGDEAAASLFVLMGILENSTHPKLLANTAKHFAFTRCSESNLFGMVDAQVTVVEDELLAGMTCLNQDHMSRRFRGWNRRLNPPSIRENPRP